MTRSSALTSTRPHRGWRGWRGWIWLCLAALLGFQALGLVHRSLHGAGGHPSRVAAAVSTALAQAAGEDTSSLSFGHAAGTPDCQLLDQLSHALGPMVQAFAWTAQAPDIPAGVDQPHDAMLAQLWRKGARGPPQA